LIVLLDTSGFLCLLQAHDERHASAVRLYRSASRHITHNYVIAELVALAEARRVPRATALGLAARIVEDPKIQIVWVDRGLHRVALALLQDRMDKTYSLCDAVSFLVMRERGVLEALTTDHHFEQEGLVRLLPR
jgi:predicted nucleic acid-binding protein